MCAGVVLAVVGVVAAAFVMASPWGPFVRVEGRGVPAREANARLWHCRVPDGATDVWYESGYRGTRVECLLSVEEFRAWCAREGWRPMPIAEGEPFLQVSEREGVIEVRRGLRFEALRGDAGHLGVYDEERRRAFVSFSGG
jgi:hypothetical protein